jgi:hypothetical protein
MIPASLIQIGEYIVVKYEPQLNPNWPTEHFSNESNEEDEVRILRAFFVTKQKLDDGYSLFSKQENVYDREGSYCFVIAKLNEEKTYYILDKDILGIEFDLYIDSDIDIKITFFTTDNFPVFRFMGHYYKDASLYIVSDEKYDDESKGYMPISVFEHLLQNIPNKREIDAYKLSRYSSVLNNYIEGVDGETKLEKIVNRKLAYIANNKDTLGFPKIDLAKFETLLLHFEKMLDEYNNYSEDDWQKEILKVFRTIYPKYVYVGEKLKLKSFDTGSNLEVDITLTDFEGNIDLIEIKKPSPYIFYKRNYRDNSYPVREITGTCMQLQNYLLSLQKTSFEELNKEKSKKQLQVPPDFNVKAITPKGIIIYGLEDQLIDNKTKNDFQILKSMYVNIVDFITYNDLKRRLERIIESLKS